MSNPTSSPSSSSGVKGLLKTAGKLALFGVATLYATQLLFKESWKNYKAENDKDEKTDKNDPAVESPETPVISSVSPSFPMAPLRLAILSPLSLASYGKLLHEAFLAASQNADFPVPLACVDHFSPSVGESSALFSQRIRNFPTRYDLLLVQFHASQGEIPIAFENFHSAEKKEGESGEESIFPPLTILLLHRPEEALERHWQRLFTQNIHSLLGRSAATVLLGGSMRRLFTNICPKTVVIPHGFSGLDDFLVSKPKSIAKIACVGCSSSFGDMRWVGDFLALHAQYMKLRHSLDPQGGLLFFLSGSFASFVNPQNKQIVDELAAIRASPGLFNVTFVSEADLESALADNRFRLGDSLSFKEYLFSLSDFGSRVLIVPEFIKSPALHIAQNELIDFNLQLYREILKDFRPKVEYSGSLHNFPGLNLPVVFDCPAMADIQQDEGISLITVKWSGANVLANSADGVKAPFSFFSSSYYPDFSPVLQQIFMFQQNEALFEAQRRKNFQAAKMLNFKEIAKKYGNLIKQLKEQ